MLTELHRRERLKNSHEYRPTRFEVEIGRRFCCALAVVRRERHVMLRRIALHWSANAFGDPFDIGGVVRFLGADFFMSDTWSFDECLAYFWFRWMPKEHRRFVDERATCEGV